jgi:hypothetical protein
VAERKATPLRDIDPDGQRKTALIVEAKLAYLCAFAYIAFDLSRVEEDLENRYVSDRIFIFDGACMPECQFYDHESRR